MTKIPTKRSSASSRKNATDLIPLRLQHPAAVAVILVSLIVFFWPVVGGGKTFMSPDNIASHSWDTALKEAGQQGIFPLWNPYIFCGMPGYASLTFSGERLFDFSAVVLGKASVAFQYLLFNAQSGWVLFYYFLFGAGMYLFVFSKTRHKIAALTAAMAAMYSTYIAVWIMIGHNTKIAVVAFLPFIFYLIERLREKFDWRLALLLVALLHFSFIPSHVQMIFYMYLAVGIYFLYYLIRSFLKKEDWKGVLRAGLVVAAASVLAFAMDADKYLSVWEYNPYSIRGSSPIVQTPGEGGKTQEGGLGYDYATNWSFAPGEMMTFVVPSWYGFGPLQYEGRYTAKPERVNLYWGPQPFVDGAQYMGIVILVFAVIGFWRNRRESFVQFAAITIVIALFVSFGKELPLLYDLMFKYFPMFNKFRVPSMILVLVQILVPVLAAYGIRSVLLQAAEGYSPLSDKRWKSGVLALGILLVLSFIARDVVASIYSGFFPMTEVGQNLARMLRTNQPAVVQEFYGFVVSTVTSEISIALLLLTAVFGALWLAGKRSLSLTVAAVLIVAVSTIDLWRIAWRSMEPQPRTQQQEIFATPAYVSALQQDTSMYRVLQFINGQMQYDNTLAYWRIQNAYGYQGAKIRAYQDIVEVVGLGNPLVQQLMNVKYLIMNQPDSALAPYLAYNGPDMLIYRNPAFAPRAFFVNRYETLSGMQILNKMATMAFNPADVAYFMDDPNVAVDPPQAGVSAVYVRHGLQDLALNVTATGNNLLFLSEAWYPGGWKAFIDGIEIPIYRVNYMFRGVVVPKGTHQLEMRFEPSGFSLGKNLSLAANILVIGGLGFGLFDWWRKEGKRRALRSEK